MPRIDDHALSELQTALSHDTRIKVAGLDVDGILRGKIMAKSKFLSALKNDGFGMVKCMLEESYSNSRDPSAA